MKRFVCAAISGLAMLGFAQNVLAADLDYLRGSNVFEPQYPTYDRWSGFYLGGQAGYSNAQMDFTHAAESLVAYVLRNSTLEDLGHVSQWSLLGTANKRDVSWGGFIGYNSQWENVILGIEANYNRLSLNGESSGSLSRRVSPGDGLIYDATVSADASMKITDVGTVRGRAGWVMGRFLPYAMLGFALGRVETARSATVEAIVTDPSTGITFPYGPFTKFENRAVYAFGYAAGAGVDIALLDNVFVRAEFEWVRFANLPNMTAQLATGRVAAGLKF